VAIHDDVSAILKKAKLNRKEIASNLGVSLQLISQWSTGKELIGEPHLARLIELEGPSSREAKEREFLRLLLVLWQERIERENDQDKDKQRWTDSTKDLARRALKPALDLATTRTPNVKSSGRTLCDFPDSFYPLAIVSGDKREDSESRITAADFGAVSASPAEFRWLCELGLQGGAELYGDKVFVLENVEELKARFGKRHLLIVGSPGSNHLARRCQLVPPRSGWRSTAAIFRFNVAQSTLRKIDEFVESVKELKRKQLVGRRAEESTELVLKNSLHNLFTGGIVDPTARNYWVRGQALRSERDYGLITLARNPLSEPGDSYLCIVVAGFHLFGTAHALRMLANINQTNPQETFARHPLGGVIKVLINPDVPFAKRFDESTVEWDDKVGYEIDDLRKRLKEMQGDLAHTLNFSSEEIDECLSFLDSL
jgi:DNA-binding transcriptional regulator YiaG